MKYLIGKVSLIQSVDSIPLAEEIDRLSQKHGVATGVLAQINIGREQTKSGFPTEEALAAAEKLSAFPNLRLKGLMAMLPAGAESGYLKDLCLQMREFYDIIKKRYEGIEHLSVGMSEDYKIAVANGSNMIRLGSAIFGRRNYEG